MLHQVCNSPQLRQHPSECCAWTLEPRGLPSGWWERALLPALLCVFSQDCLLQSFGWWSSSRPGKLSSHTHSDWHSGEGSRSRHKPPPRSPHGALPRPLQVPSSLQARRLPSLAQGFGQAPPGPLPVSWPRNAIKDAAGTVEGLLHLLPLPGNHCPLLPSIQRPEICAFSDDVWLWGGGGKLPKF